MLELVLYGLLVAALWALGPVLQKIILKRDVSSTTIIVIGGIFSIIFGISCLFFIRKDLIKDIEKLDIEVLGIIAITSIICGIVATFVFLHILKKYDACLVNAIVYTSPIFTLIFAMWILGEPVSWLSILGAVIIIIGVITTTLGQKK